MLRLHFLRTVKGTISRFLSIFLIVLLGVAFFTGIRASGPDMRLSADIYYDRTALQDIRVLSPLGLTHEDAEALSGVEGVSETEEGIFLDVFTDGRSEPVILRLMTLPEKISTVTVREGRLPEEPGEALVDVNFASETGLSIGDSFTITCPEDTDREDWLIRDTFTITGTAVTPLYLSLERGSTQIGSGSLDSYVFLPKEAFCSDIITEVRILVDGAGDLACYSDAYEDKVQAVCDKIAGIESDRVRIRFEEVAADGIAQVEEGRSELDKAKKALADARQELIDGEKELDEAEALLADKEQEIKDGRAKIEAGKTQLASSKALLDAAWNTYNGHKAHLSEMEASYAENARVAALDLSQADALDAEYAAEEQAIAEDTIAWNLTGGASELARAEAAVRTATLRAQTAQNLLTQAQEEESAILAGNSPEFLLPSVQSRINIYARMLEDAKASLSENEDTARTLRAESDALDQRREQQPLRKARAASLRNEASALTASNQTLSGTIETLRSSLADGLLTLNEQQAKYDAAAAEIEEGEAQLIDGARQIEEGYKELEEGRQTLADGWETYKAEAQKAAEEISSHEADLADAEEALEELSKTTWYVTTRSAIETYVEYGQNADRVIAIGNVFPVIFFLVAALICLTTMTRMVEEDRSEIGTLKALGYSTAAITAQYIAYSLSASVLGSVLGAVLGQKTLPYVIISAYKILYTNLPEIHQVLYPGSSLFASLAACGITTAAAVATCLKSTKENAASLMRPSAPRAGKRILLERIPAIWRRCSFTTKATFRNLFRYKKRFFMTITGIGGCMGVLLTGFGLRDSIMAIGDSQFGVIDFHDGEVVFADGLSMERKQEIFNTLNNSGLLTVSTLSYNMTNSFSSAAGDARYTGYLVVPHTEVWTDGSEEFAGDFSDLVDMHDRLRGTSYSLDDSGCVISEKLSTLLGIGEGDEIRIWQSDTESFSVPVAHVMENYFYHYVYMTPALYESASGKDAPTSGLMFRMKGEGKETEEAIRTLAMDQDGVLGLGFLTGMRTRISGMLKAMDAIIYVIILAAGALAFVVLYNLNSITIEERRREIATLKVLGFRRNETSAYILKENIYLTGLGCAAGVVIGRPLHYFVIRTAEIEIMMFGRGIKPVSYVYSIVLTIVFSFLVNLYMHRRLNRINMVESLKSVE